MSITLRQARYDDAFLLHTWRNEPTTYTQCRVAAPVSWPEHIAWLQRVLADENRYLYIAELDEIAPVGVVRLDKLQDKLFEINVTIPSVYRGRGYGSIIIDTAINNLLKIYKSVRVIAYIKADNVASVRAFEKAGFRLTDSDAERMLFECESSS